MHPCSGGDCGEPNSTVPSIHVLKNTWACCFYYYYCTSAWGTSAWGMSIWRKPQRWGLQVNHRGADFEQRAYTAKQGSREMNKLIWLCHSVCHSVCHVSRSTSRVPHFPLVSHLYTSHHWSSTSHWPGGRHPMPPTCILGEGRSGQALDLRAPSGSSPAW